jgi:hypothetical protein
MVATAARDGIDCLPLFLAHVQLRSAVSVTWANASKVEFEQVLDPEQLIFLSELVIVSAGSLPSTTTVRLVGLNVATIVRSESTLIVRRSRDTRTHSSRESPPEGLASG